MTKKRKPAVPTEVHGWHGDHPAVAPDVYRNLVTSVRKRLELEEGAPRQRGRR